MAGLATLSVVTYSENIGTSLKVSSAISSNGGLEITEKGFCYSTTEIPTIDDSKIVVTGDDFETTITDLSRNTTYYIRAYAVNSIGISYSNCKYVKTPPIGAIGSGFSVAANKQVFFSQGNLQYQGNTDTWRFAEDQYDMIGEDNSNISYNYSGWIDLFGWGNSGYNDKYPYLTSTYGFYDGSNDIDGTNYDWGVNNKIVNGGNQAGLWRTLTKDEWSYLIDTRTDASSKKGVATVNSVTGLVLLPDDWNLPADVTFTSGANGDFAQNTYSVEDWAKMEANGAVFLPAAGYRSVTDMVNIGSQGRYWSSSSYDNTESYSGALFFRSYEVNASAYGYRRNGESVRLVKDVE